MVVRKATSHEIEQILYYSPIVMKEATMGLTEVRKDAALKMISQILADGGYYLVFSEDKEIRGWISVGRSYNYFTDEMEGMIPELYVLPKFRKKGIAKELLESALNRLKKEGFKKVQLNVYSGNPAKHLYKKAGFIDISSLMTKEFN